MSTTRSVLYGGGVGPLSGGSLSDGSVSKGISVQRSAMFAGGNEATTLKPLISSPTLRHIHSCFLSAHVNLPRSRPCV